MYKYANLIPPCSLCLEWFDKKIYQLMRKIANLGTEVKDLAEKGIP